MRPLKLTMQAFGPYAGREEVDFRDAVASGLFGIYGPTGAGKSSIFSAMTFALFGQAAKPEQPISTLRSDHATAGILTEVEFAFELAAKTYYLIRRPDQMRPKERGEGETSEKHCAWIFDATGVPLEELSVSNPGRVLAEKKVTEVDRVVRDLLGYGHVQFRQIVLLPQGRFEAFLASSSNERLAILRELFDVSVYRQLSEKFSDDAKAAEREVQGGRELCAARLGEKGFESSDALREGIGRAKVDATTAQELAAEAETKLTEATEAYLKAQATDARFVEAEAAQANLQALEEQAAEIAAARQRLQRLQLAEKLSDLDHEVGEADAAVTRAQAEVEKSEAEVEDAEQKQQEARHTLDAQLARSTETEALRTERDTVVRHASLFERTASLREEAAAAAEAHLSRQTALQTARDDQTRLERRRQQLERSLTSAQSASVRRAHLTSDLHTAKSALSVAEEYQVLSRSVAAAAEAYAGAEKFWEAARNARQEAEDDYLLLRGRLAAAQAQRLAATLIDGEPCPVCGSPDHPKPAAGDTAFANLEIECETAEAALISCQKVEAEAHSELVAARTSHGERSAAIEKLSAPERDIAALAAAVSTLEASLGDLGPEVDVAQLEEQFTSTQRDLTAAFNIVEAAAEKEQEAGKASALAAQELKLALQEIPERLQSTSALSREQERLEAEIAGRDTALEAAQKNFANRQAASATAVANHDNAQKRLATELARAQRLAAQLDSRLSEQGLTAEEYGELKQELSLITTLTARCDEHDRNLNSAKGRVEQAKAAIADVERPDLDILDAQKLKAESAAQDARNSSAEALATVKTLETLADDLKSEFERLERIEAESGPLRALAAAFRGENQARTPLETYAIGALFDHVLASANLRFGPMSGGRYRLERNVEATGGRAKRGLDLSVHDVHTGRAREICTLSGGETFIAALSLALGLSDVVETSHGKIRLDTIFIDEGFGSLDAEDESGTLDQVLQVLQNIVGRSRAVGVISHVSLVQQAIPSGFTIRKDPCGSSVEKRSA